MPPRILRSPLKWAMFALGVFTAALTLAPEPVQAQGLFDTLRGLFGRGGFGGRMEDEQEGPYQAYCVRLCDGRFFPLPASDARERERGRERSFFFRDYRDERKPTINTSGSASPENLCKAMCPATPVKVFSGTLIDNAVAGDGAVYSKLRNAFVYREKMIAECSCNGVDNTGVANLDAESDPTLQPGDIIVTPDGPKVYRGGNRGQPTPASFVPVKEYRGMSDSMRKNLSEMRITRVPEPVTARSSNVVPSAGSSPAANVERSPAEDIMNRGFVP